MQTARFVAGLTGVTPPAPLRRAEEAYVDALWELREIPEDRDRRRVCGAVVDLLAGWAPGRARAMGPLFFHRFGGGNSPDFCVLDRADNVLIAVEVKLDAQAAATSWWTFDRATRFEDRHSRTMRARLPSRRLGWHPYQGQDPTTGNFRCGCTWHTSGPRGGLVRGGLAQIDGYRLSRRWADRYDLHIADPGRVHWILLDRHGRSAADAFAPSVTAAQWRTVTLLQMAQRLAALREDHPARSATRAAIDKLLSATVR